MSEAPAVHRNPILLQADLIQDLDEATAALAALDAERLEAVEHRLRSRPLLDLAEQGTALSALLLRHSMLGRMLEATAANMRVLAAIRQLGSELQDAQHRRGGR